MKQNLCVFCVFDAEGIIDEYVIYLLRELCRMHKETIVVCNGSVDEESLDKLNHYASDVIVRENVGFDATAYKYVLESIIGWNNLVAYDELTLINDSCFGPIYPLRDVFNEMNQESPSVHFWGITGMCPRRNSFTPDWGAYFPYHIQSYFLVIRKEMLHNAHFRFFWDTMKTINTYHDAILVFEMRFTQYFNDAGFRSGVYVRYPQHSSENEWDMNFVYMHHDAFRLVSEFKCPFLKKRNFSHPLSDTLEFNIGEDMSKTMKYICEETDYDVNMIYDHVIRTCDIKKLYESLHLHYIVSSKVVLDSSESCKRVLVMLNNVSCILAPLDWLTFSTVNGTMYCSTLIDNYDYICYVDAPSSLDDTLSQQHASNTSHYIKTENTITNYTFIKNVVHCFENDKRLGFLSVPVPYHSILFGGSKTEFLDSSAFWCRSEILRGVSKEDFYKMDKAILPDVSKNEGYYSGTVMSEEFASLTIINYKYMLDGMRDKLTRTHQIEKYSDIEFLQGKGFSDFCCRYAEIYVYGAGFYADKCIRLVNNNANRNIKGVIVSDGHKTSTLFKGYPVYCISDIQPNEDVGIILALNENNQNEVYPDLNSRGFLNVYRV